MHKLDGLLVNQPIGVVDALVNLADVTGLTDQQLREKMPDLKGQVTLLPSQDENGVREIKVQMNDFGWVGYVITLPETGTPTFAPKDWRGSSGPIVEGPDGH
jgi:hypothetical protein